MNRYVEPALSAPAATGQPQPYPPITSHDNEPAECDILEASSNEPQASEFASGERPLCEEWAESKRRPVNEEVVSLDRRSLLRNIGVAAVMTSAGTLAATSHRVNASQSASQSPSMRRNQAITSPTSEAAEALPSIEIIALNRMAFGPRPGDLADFLALGNTPDEQLATYVEQQLNPAAIDDSACDAIIAQQGYVTMDMPLAEVWNAYTMKRGEANQDNDRLLPVREVEKAAFLRAIHSKRQLTEVLADFWHNHFNVYGWNRWEGSTFRHYDRDVIRAYMFGNFREMLEAVAKSPAMLYYLDNQSNEGGDPNENYARELFELHAMGAENYLGVIEDNAGNYDRIYDENGEPMGYIDAWVYGATTCFTGWQADSENGQFVFNDSAHFPFAKIVLGQTLPDFQGEKDGHDVLDMLVNHPGTARYIARKLCRRLITDNPPESVVQAAADVFRANIAAPDQLTQVVRTILLSEEFKTTWAEKIKRPFEYAVSLMRSLEYDFQPREHFFWRYDPGGQPLFAWPAPDGFPDVKERWTGTMSMLQRMRLCNFLIDWKYPGDSPNADQRYFRPEETTPSSLTTPQQLVDYWSNRILGRALPPNSYTEIVEFMASGRNVTQDLPREDIDERLRYMIALILMSSTFMLR